jgi:hypothetical protein
VSARLFTDDELERLATPLSIHLERAADARDDGAIDWIRDQLDQETLAIYDPYISWMGVLQSFVVERAGEDGHDRALLWAAEYAYRPFVARYRGLGLRQRAELLAERLRASGSTFRAEEDERSLRFVCDPLGPERWWRRPAGFEAEALRQREGDRYRYPCYEYFEPPVSFATLSDARPLTQGRSSLPCLLASEILFLELLPIELLGAPIAAVELGERPEDPTVLELHRDPAHVPAEVYERVDTAKPAGGLPAEPTGRSFSDQELERLGTPLSLQVEAAAEAGDWARLRAISARMDAELVGAKDPSGIAIAGLLSWIARHLGEGAAEQALARTAEVVMAPFLGAVRDLDISEALPMWAMVWRAHGSTFRIEETDHTFVLRGRPLGACHRMWSTAYQPEVERISDSRVRYPTFGCFDDPASFHLMREPRGITYGRSGYPIYSCHCHMLHEIYPIDQLGHPLWVEEHPLDDRDGETVHVHYKDPAEWPERYYERVGRRKPARVGG